LFGSSAQEKQAVWVLRKYPFAFYTSINNMMKRILRIYYVASAIVVAHRLLTIRYADRIHLLHRGRIRETGTHDELMAKQGIYYNFCRKQAYLLQNLLTHRISTC